MGRVYVQMPKDVPLEYEPWVMGLRDGRSYVGDGSCHIGMFAVDGVHMGQEGSNGQTSQLVLRHPGTVKVKTQVAAMLTPEPNAEAKAIRGRRLDEKPYWHIERARMEGTRQVPVELIVNGEVFATRNIDADGKMVDLEWDVPLQHSSWIALRVFPSMHTNPIFVEVDGLPIRASQASARWCRKAVDVCWEKKKGQIKKEELELAAAAYDAARASFDRIIQESK